MHATPCDVVTIFTFWYVTMHFTPCDAVAMCICYVTIQGTSCDAVAMCICYVTMHGTPCDAVAMCICCYVTMHRTPIDAVAICICCYVRMLGTWIYQNVCYIYSKFLEHILFKFIFAYNRRLAKVFCQMMCSYYIYIQEHFTHLFTSALVKETMRKCYVYSEIRHTHSIFGAVCAPARLLMLHRSESADLGSVRCGGGRVRLCGLSLRPDCLRSAGALGTAMC